MAGEEHRPRVIFCNSAAEYWRGDASMAHMTLPDRAGGAAGADLEDAPGTRSFLFASTQHGSSKAASAPTPQPEGIPGDGGFVTAAPSCAPPSLGLGRPRSAVLLGPRRYFLESAIGVHDTTYFWDPR